MMSTASPWLSAFSALNSWLPEWAIVPRFFSSSSAVMPMPLSEMVSVRASLSKETRLARSSPSSWTLPSDRLLKLSLSTASDALEMSSRRKISLLV